jgi:hypothetical protein
MTRAKPTLTPRQQQALADIFPAQQFKALGARIISDILNAGLRRILAALIPHGLVKGKPRRVARRTDNRLTVEGERIADEIFARPSGEAVMQTITKPPSL